MEMPGSAASLNNAAHTICIRRACFRWQVLDALERETCAATNIKIK
jgi:hypothetical protein